MARTLDAQDQLESDVFHALMEAADLKDVDKNDLMNRGYTEEMIQQMNFKSMPHTLDEATELVDRMLSKHPELEDAIRQGRTPGCFVRADNGKCATLWEYGYYCPAYDDNAVTNNGTRTIAGIQLRKSRPLVLDFGNGDPKYTWLRSGVSPQMLVADGYVNSKGEPDYGRVQDQSMGQNFKRGVTAAIYKGGKTMTDASGKEHPVVIITEGVLKSSLAYYGMGKNTGDIKDKYTVIGLPGVGMMPSCMSQIKETLNDAVVIECFDADKKTNDNVMTFSNRIGIDAIQDGNAFMTIHGNWDDMQNDYIAALEAAGETPEKAAADADHDTKGIDDVSVVSSRIGKNLRMTIDKDGFIGGGVLYNRRTLNNLGISTGYDDTFDKFEVNGQGSIRQNPTGKYRQLGLSDIIDNVSSQGAGAIDIPDVIEIETADLHAPVKFDKDKSFNPMTLDEAASYLSSHVFYPQTHSIGNTTDSKGSSQRVINNIVNGLTGNTMYTDESSRTMRNALLTIRSADTDELLESAGRTGNGVCLVEAVNRTANDCAYKNAKLYNRMCKEAKAGYNLDDLGGKTPQARADEYKAAHDVFTDTYTKASAIAAGNPKAAALLKQYEDTSDVFEVASSEKINYRKATFLVSYEGGAAYDSKTKTATPYTADTAMANIRNRIGKVAKQNGLFVYANQYSNKGLTMQPVPNADVIAVSVPFGDGKRSLSNTDEYRVRAVAKTLTQSCMAYPGKQMDWQHTNSVVNYLWNQQSNHVSDYSSNKAGSIENVIGKVAPTVTITKGPDKIVEPVPEKPKDIVEPTPVKQPVVMADPIPEKPKAIVEPKPEPKQAVMYNDKVKKPEPDRKVPPLYDLIKQIADDPKNYTKDYKLNPSALGRTVFNRDISGAKKYGMDKDLQAANAKQNQLYDDLHSYGYRAYDALINDMKDHPDGYREIPNAATIASAAGLASLSAQFNTAFADLTKEQRQWQAANPGAAFPRSKQTGVMARSRELTAFMKDHVTDPTVNTIAKYNMHKIALDGNNVVDPAYNLIPDIETGGAMGSIKPNLYETRFTIPCLNSDSNEAMQNVSDRLDWLSKKNGLRLYDRHIYEVADMTDETTGPMRNAIGTKGITVDMHFGLAEAKASDVIHSVSGVKRSTASYANQGFIPEKSKDAAAYQAFWKSANRLDFSVANGNLPEVPTGGSGQDSTGYEMQEENTDGYDDNPYEAYGY